MQLEEAIVQTLKMAGYSVLEDPRRLLAYLLDLCHDKSPEMQVLKNNCDDQMLAPFVRVAHMTSPDANDLAVAARYAELYLRDERMIGTEAARRLSRHLARALGCVLGMSPEALESLRPEPKGSQAAAKPLGQRLTSPVAVDEAGPAQDVAVTRGLTRPAPTGYVPARPVPSEQPFAPQSPQKKKSVLPVLLVLLVAGGLAFALLNTGLGSSLFGLGNGKTPYSNGGDELQLVPEPEPEPEPELEPDPEPEPEPELEPEPEPELDPGDSSGGYGPATFSSTSYMSEVWDFVPYFDRTPATIHNWMLANGFWVDSYGSDCAVYLSQYGTQFVFGQSTTSPESTSGYTGASSNDQSPLLNDMRWRVMRVHFWGEGLDYAIDKCHLSGESWRGTAGDLGTVSSSYMMVLSDAPAARGSRDGYLWEAAYDAGSKYCTVIMRVG